MSETELARLLAAGDTHGLVVAAVRLHADRSYPGWRCASGIIDVSPGLPHAVILVLPTPAASPPAPKGAELPA